MFSHIHNATIIVADQDAALDFYVNTLGWEKSADQRMSEEMRWLTVKPKGALTELALGVAAWFEGENVPGPGRTGISLVSPDIEATYTELTAKGVRFKQPIEMMPWGMKATWFYDPDGNEFFLVG